MVENQPKNAPSWFLNVEHMDQKLEIGQPLHVTVYWYDKVPEPPELEEHDGEVIGWRESQMIVRVPNYSVLRFWKRNGVEVGNPDHKRRGFRVDLSALSQSIKTNNQEVEIDMPVAIDTDA
jgi:hypothetical protein